MAKSQGSFFKDFDWDAIDEELDAEEELPLMLAAQDQLGNAELQQQLGLGDLPERALVQIAQMLG